MPRSALTFELRSLRGSHYRGGGIGALYFGKRGVTCSKWMAANAQGKERFFENGRGSVRMESLTSSSKIPEGGCREEGRLSTRKRKGYSG